MAPATSQAARLLLSGAGSRYLGSLAFVQREVEADHIDHGLAHEAPLARLAEAAHEGLDPPHGLVTRPGHPLDLIERIGY
jgi:hypothetical protein